MSAIHVGTNLRRVRQQLGWDPQRGATLVETYTGHPNAVLSLRNSLIGANVTTQYEEEAGRATLYATWSDDNDGNNTEVPSDHYEIAKDYVQESIWSAPQIWALALNDASTVSVWKSLVETAVSENKNVNNSGLTGYPLQIFKHYTAGTTSFETERLTLRRVRTFSLRYLGRATLDAVPKVYSVASLQSVFGIPSAITDRLPAAPSAAPELHSWGWKRRQDSTSITYSGRVEEVMDWVFAPWSTVLHTFV
jgi:hypothetical protein